MPGLEQLTVPPNPSAGSLLVQPDGKIVVFGTPGSWTDYVLVSRGLGQRAERRGRCDRVWLRPVHRGR
jgi:hypothetical protein